MENNADVAMCPSFSSLAEQILAVFEARTLLAISMDAPSMIKCFRFELSRVGYDPLPFLSIDRIDVIDLVREHFHIAQHVYTLLTGGENSARTTLLPMSEW